MAKVNGLFGRASGKVANLVFASWKGIQYARLYVVPGNPKTPGQIAARALFASAVSIAKSILGSVLHTFVDPFLTKNSAYAFFIGRTIKNWAGTFDMTTVKMTEGPLEKAVLSSAVYAGANVTFTWSSAILGNGLATDKACCVVIDIANHVAFFSSSAARSAGGVAVAVGAGRAEAFMHAYLFMTDSATAPTTVSDTEYSGVTV